MSRHNQSSITSDEILQLGLGFGGSKTLLSTVGLGVVTQLSAGPLDAATLAERASIFQTG